MDTKIIAIIVAVVVVGAAGAAVLVMNNDSGDKENGQDFDTNSGALLIYGNANMDTVIDGGDITAIQAMIDKGEYNIVADANMDGSVDSEDIEVVNRIIAGTQTKLYYMDKIDGATAVNYPITSFMGIHQFVLIPMVAIGALPYMDGYTLAPSGVEGAAMLQELYDTQTNVNTSYNTVDIEKLSSLEKKPEIMMAYNTLSNENKLEKSGIQIMHLDFNSFKGSISAIRTAGYLLNLSDKANQYVDFIDDVVKDIEAKVISKIDDASRKTVICGYMTNCIDHGNGTYTPMAEAAGAKGLMGSDTNTYVEFNRGDEWILSYNEDMFFYMQSWGYAEHIDLAQVYTKSADYFTSLKSYKDGNFVVFNSVMPPVLTAAYMAEALYPDLVGTGYGDSVNQKYIDTFFPSFAEGFDVTDYDFMITYDMVKDLL
ncbi:MAG: ABC transporter substrate-binding protein [Candidatus Methanomethylophilaceae archaeon]